MTDVERNNTVVGYDEGKQDKSVIFVVYPGEVQSPHDEQIHNIGYRRLIELYKLDGNRCVRGDYPQSLLGMSGRKICPIGPRHDGRYPIFEGGKTR